MQFWTIRDFERMAIPKIVGYDDENRWAVLFLRNGMRIKFRKW